MAKNSNSYCSSEGKNGPDKKSTASSQKKFGWRLEDFAHIFGKLTTPYGMFEWQKNSNSYCSSEEKNGPDKKRSASSQKKFG